MLVIKNVLFTGCTFSLYRKSIFSENANGITNFQLSRSDWKHKASKTNEEGKEKRDNCININQTFLTLSKYNCGYCCVELSHRERKKVDRIK